MDNLLIALVGAMSAITAGAVAWFTARKRMGGTVRSSEAIDLWKESGEIRRELRVQIKELFDRQEELELEAETCRSTLKTIQDQYGILDEKYNVLLHRLGGREEP